ncbi:unnamed protein product [Adineta steineri]|uniref:NAD(P)(+)--arginine ADP-ribosyltransferase n=1 Tax=Adineta steineri TaxID=433720 RepID=A0A818SG21_9BILA|nr:unnamed protein product [Adineta steineri]CAF3670363.1 unnamed protein product [Adineta steineri]
MTTQTRLFARTCEVNHNFVQTSSPKKSIILLLDTFSDVVHLRHKLDHLSNCHYFQAYTTDHCLDLINKDYIKDGLVLLIISTRFVDFVFDTLLEIMPQLSYIYLFGKVSCNKYLIRDLRFHGIFNNSRLLIDQIRQDIENFEYSTYKSEGIQYILEHSATFFWYRFFFNILDRLKQTDIAKHEMISRVRVIYEDNIYKLAEINHFENVYYSDDVISWYTKDSFFYLHLNRALRSHDINEIFLWRFYISDLDRNLRKLCSKQMDSQSRCVFRGQRLHKYDLYKLAKSEGKLISMTSFLSTSLDHDVAEMFAEDTLADSPFRSVIYKIFIESNTNKIVCADISDLSEVVDEQEVLFSIRSLFRIERVKYSDSICYIDLTAVDEDDQQFGTAINPWKAKISEQSFFSGHHEPLFTRFLIDQNSSFLAFQLLTDIMLRLHQTEFARQEMIEICRLKYENSLTDLEKINEFERSYQHSQAIEWYTTNSFLYRLLLQALRMEDIDTIFKLRYYIYDLHNQLAQLHTSYLNSLPSDQRILTLYRGQRMKITELTRLQQNVDKLISMNSFLSTTNNVTAAVFFAGDGCLNDPNGEVSVVYQITIDTSVPHSIPFAKIQYESIFEDEDEVLFSMASVFRIDNVEKYETLWVVELTLISKEDETWNILTDHLKNSISAIPVKLKRERRRCCCNIS